VIASTFTPRLHYTSLSMPPCVSAPSCISVVEYWKLLEKAEKVVAAGMEWVAGIELNGGPHNIVTYHALRNRS